jgi:hypothetical protein
VGCGHRTSSGCANWKKKNRQLKQISTDLLLENRALKDVIAKKL